MVDKTEMPGRNVVDLRSYRKTRSAGGKAGTSAQAMTARLCRHCGAALLDGESDDDCSSANVAAPILRKFYAD